MSQYDPNFPSNHNSVPHAEEEDFYRLTLYEVLGVSEGATAEDIKRAYKKRILEYHPDKNINLDAEVATRRFRRIQEAYEVLADPQQRRQYDIQRNPQRHRYASTPPSTASTKQTFTHHHYHFRPPATTSSTPMQSFSFTFSSSSQASFSFGFSSSSSSSPSTTTTTAQNQGSDNPEVLWSFSTHGGRETGHQPPLSSTGNDDGTRKYRNNTTPSSGSDISSGEEDEDESESSQS